MGCDSTAIEPVFDSKRFQFTHPVWGATYQIHEKLIEAGFQFTHPVWGAT